MKSIIFLLAVLFVIIFCIAFAPFIKLALNIAFGAVILGATMLGVGYYLGYTHKKG